MSVNIDKCWRKVNIDSFEDGDCQVNGGVGIEKRDDGEDYRWKKIEEHEIILTKTGGKENEGLRRKREKREERRERGNVTKEQ